MTKHELSQLHYLNREIESDKRRLAELERAENGKTTRLVGIPSAPKIVNRLTLEAEMADLRNIIAAKIQQAMAELNRLNRYINTVEDSQIRQILTLRYVNSFNWKQVARHIGGGNTEEGVRKKLNRFFDEQ